MASIFKPKRRTADATAPTTSNLADGELAVNLVTPTIYVRNGGAIVDLFSGLAPKANPTFTGTVTGAIGAFTTSIASPIHTTRVGSSGKGYVALEDGDATHTGTVRFSSAALANVGSIGFATGTAIEIRAESGWNYNFIGNNPQVGGQGIWHAGNFDPTLKQSVNSTLSTLISNPWSANAVPVGLGATGMNQITMNANQFIARSSSGNAVAKGITDAALAAVAGMVGKTAYTPTIVGSATPGAGTYTVQTGFYCQFGPITFFKATVGITAHTGAGTARITLPVAAANDVCNQPISVGILDNFTTGATTQVNVDVLANTNHARILGLPLGGGTTAGQALDTAFNIQIAGWYFHQ